MNNFQKLISEYWVFVFGILLFSIFSIISLKNGISLSYDSCAYLASAVSWKEKGIFLDTFENQNLLWPPLYSVIIAFFGVNELSLAFINYISLCLTILLWISFIKEHFSNTFYHVLFAILIASSTAFLLCEKFVWSECLFTLIISLYVILTFKYFKKQSLHYLIILTIIGAIIPLQRIAGLYIFFYLWVGVILFYYRNNHSKISLYILHIFIVIIPFAIWYYQTLGGMAIREVAVYNVSFFFEVIKDFNLVISRYLYPDFLSAIIPYPLFLPIFIITFIVFFFYTNRINIKISIFLYLGYTITYIITILMKKAGAGHQEIERFLSPIYPVFCFILCCFIQEVMSLIKEQNKQRLLMIIIFCWSIYPLARVVKNARLYGSLPKKTGVSIPCNYLNK